MTQIKKKERSQKGRSWGRTFQVILRLRNHQTGDEKAWTIEDSTRRRGAEERTGGSCYPVGIAQRFVRGGSTQEAGRVIKKSRGWAMATVEVRHGKRICLREMGGPGLETKSDVINYGLKVTKGEEKRKMSTKEGKKKSRRGQKKE